MSCARGFSAITLHARHNNAPLSLFRLTALFEPFCCVPPYLPELFFFCRLTFMLPARFAPRAIAPCLAVFCSPAATAPALTSRLYLPESPSHRALATPPGILDNFTPNRPRFSFFAHLLLLLSPHAMRPEIPTPPFFLIVHRCFCHFSPVLCYSPRLFALFASPGLFLLSPTLRAPFAPCLPRHNAAPAETFLPRQSPPAPKKRKTRNRKTRFHAEKRAGAEIFARKGGRSLGWPLFQTNTKNVSRETKRREKRPLRVYATRLSDRTKAKCFT